MKTISLKLPAALDAKLTRAAKQAKRSKSETVRAALDQYLNGTAAKTHRGPMSALELAGDLVGCADGPSDLSSNPAHMEGYGE